MYGSLKKGKYNHVLLEESEYLGDTEVVGTLYGVSSYPAIVAEGNNRYHAEIYRVDESTFNRIHSMELGAGYKEMTATVQGEDGTVIDDAVVYYADDELTEYCKKNKEVIEAY